MRRTGNSSGARWLYSRQRRVERDLNQADRVHQEAQEEFGQDSIQERAALETATDAAVEAQLIDDLLDGVE